jgi:hypothetical protein
MRIFRETTKWPDSTVNHIYLLTDNKEAMVGYIRQGTKSVKMFNKPIRIDMRGRTFVEVKRK